MKPMTDRHDEIAAQIAALLKEAGADVIVLKAPALTAEEVAGLLRRSPETFLSKRAELERDCNFPTKLPGFNLWSRATVLRWIETNGATVLPAPDAGPSRLERAYGVS